MSIWRHISNKLSEGKTLALLYVISSEGSSPGREGFCLVTDQEGEMYGSIGGGIMEQKLVELAKVKILSGTFVPFIKKQVHSKEPDVSQSGMICSGEQTIAFVALEERAAPVIKKIIQCFDGASTGVLQLSSQGISFEENLRQDETTCKISTESDWVFRQELGFRNRFFILGGGHVGLALSIVMRQIGFFVEILDDRPGLNTMENNMAAHKKHYIEYSKVADYVSEGDNVYVAIVSFGYRTDKEVLKNLIGRKYKYLGMMGSQEKVKEVFDALRKEGVPDKMLGTVRSPIGLPIHSKTPAEIAISIAAEVIEIMNKE